uniref:Reverse transcriptase domain-containing protein n=1 Tax=Oryzias latipes TaxID=8090 RepID=A0A3B3HL29_ORYLA
MLLYILDPLTSITSIMTILSKFGDISGYKINISKSILFPINFRNTNLNILPSFLFDVSNNFRYLGINITKDISGLFKEHFLNLYQQTDKQFK